MSWQPTTAGMVSRALRVDDASRVGEARRGAALLAMEAQLDDELQGRLAIVVTEAATNLARHARDGVLLVRALGGAEARGIEVLAVDHGPGIADTGRALQDGFSTGGSSGAGLGAMQRQADEFDLYSQPGSGTVILARLWARGRPSAPAQGADLVEGAVCLPLAGEVACGDGWGVTSVDGRSTALVVDGLGHGAAAADAAETALQIFRTHSGAAPTDLLERLNAGMRATRGAAVGVAEVQPETGTVRFAGIGNVSAVLLAPDGRSSSMPSHAGIVGHQMRKVQEFSYPWTPATVLLMHSDGLATRWRMDQYPGLLARHPSLLAAALHRDFARGRDDVTVLALRTMSGGRR